MSSPTRRIKLIPFYPDGFCTGITYFNGHIMPEIGSETMCKGIHYEWRDNDPFEDTMEIIGRIGTIGYRARSNVFKHREYLIFYEDFMKILDLTEIKQGVFSGTFEFVGCPKGDTKRFGIRLI